MLLYASAVDSVNKIECFAAAEEYVEEGGRWKRRKRKEDVVDVSTKKVGYYSTVFLIDYRR